MNTQKKFSKLSILALIALVFSFQANAQHLTDAAIKTNVNPIENPQESGSPYQYS